MMEEIDNTRSQIEQCEARAPVAGVVLYVCAVPSMMKGATIANVGVVAK